MSRKKRMRKKRLRQLLLLMAAIVIVVVIVTVVILGLKKIKTLKTLTLTPDFADVELDVNQDYSFTVKGSPAKADIKSLEYKTDDQTATFEKGSEKTKAVLHTGAEGTITVYVKKGKVESNKITLTVVDQVKKAEEEAAAKAAAEAEAVAAAQAAAEVEQEATATTLVMVTGDKVRMRAEANTDCEVVKTCKKGETFTKIETVDDWTKIDYEGRECYIKTEFLKEVTQEEADQAKAESANTEEQKPEEKKTEEKKTEEKKTEEAKPADDAAAKAAEEAKKAEEEAKKKAEEEAKKKAEADAAAAAQAQQAAASYTICGVQVTASQYKSLLDMWRYAVNDGNGSDEEVKAFHEAHHSADNIREIIAQYNLK